MMPVIVFVLLTLPGILSRDLVLTSYGGICTSPCYPEEESYYWCYQKGYSSYDWDYCSPAEGYDYKYNPCVSACKHDGYRYSWCSIPGGSWGYCGYITEEFEKQFTRYGVQCVSDCNDDDGYFRCVDSDDKYEYCSPSNYVTIRGEPCRKNHPCDFYGESYRWCYTDEYRNWDYCGSIEGACEKPLFNTFHRKKRASEGEELCRIKSSAHRRVTVFRAIPETRFSRLNKKQFMEASRIINMITADTNFATGTVYTTDTLRLDMQGDFVRDGVRYLNLQVQLNCLRQCQSSVAQALIPADLQVSRFSRYIRRALQTSLRSVYHGVPVKVIIVIERM